MKFAVTVNDRTFGVELPWWLPALLLAVGVLWQPASAWAGDRFSDAPSSNVFHADIAWMAETGVTAGCGGDRFCPDGFVTREQMSAFMHRLESKGVFATTDRVAAIEAQLEDTASDATIAAMQDEIDALTDQVAALESELTSVTGDVATLQTDVTGVTNDVATLETDLTGVTGDVTTLQNTFAGVTRAGDDLRFVGMNLHLRSGSGSTTGAVNGLGNLIIGYSENSGAYDRTGSHNLVIGRDHGWTSYGGLISGYRSQITAPYASVTGGFFNLASGQGSWVGGGYLNDATASYASVSGGYNNTASGSRSSVNGGYGNDASGGQSSVSGGRVNTASGDYSSVAGGYSNTTSGSFSTVSGGFSRSVDGQYDWRAGTLFEDS